MAHPKHIPFIFNEVLKRIRSEEGASSAIEDAEKLEDASTLRRVDASFKLAFVLAQSDLTSKDVVEMTKADAETLNYLSELAIQIGFKTRLPPTLKTREVMLRFWTGRSKALGNRLADIKKCGAVKNNWSIDWLKFGCYELTFSEAGLLCQVRHRTTGDEADIPAGASISKAYKLVDNFSDWTAHLHLPPLPAFFLHSLFDGKAHKGPYAVPGFSGRPKDLAKIADDTLAAWEKDMLASKGKASAEAWQELAAHHSAQQQGQMAKAREQAKAALAKAKARRSIAIT